MNITHSLRRAHRWSASKYREISLVVSDVRRSFGSTSGTVEDSPNPENMVWIFGSGRSGSTWLMRMMGEMGHHRVWEEPLVGVLFGDFHERMGEARRKRPDFVMADATSRGWIRSVRRFILDGARYAVPFLGPEDYLAVKEPNGSGGAPIIMEALPESRMVLLIRDPRDVVASVLDGARNGNWLHEWRKEEGNRGRGVSPDEDPDTFVRMRSRVYLRHAGNAWRAYEAHQGHKALVLYEELRADTLNTMKRIYAELKIPADERELAWAVEKHSWENIPERKKGEGKSYRKATPGSWRKDLTPRQVRMVEQITAPLLETFYI